jgi:hypothetical protein
MNDEAMPVYLYDIQEVCDTAPEDGVIGQEQQTYICNLTVKWGINLIKFTLAQGFFMWVRSNTLNHHQRGVGMTKSLADADGEIVDGHRNVFDFGVTRPVEPNDEGESGNSSGVTPLWVPAGTYCLRIDAPIAGTANSSPVWIDIYDSEPLDTPLKDVETISMTVEGVAGTWTKNK